MITKNEVANQCIAISDVMTKQPLRVSVTSTIREVIDLMYEHDIRHIPVTKDDELVGMISDRDVRSYLLPSREASAEPERSRDRLDVEVSEIIQTDVTSLTSEDSLKEAISTMIDQRIGAIPIVDNLSSKLVGILSYIDVLKQVEGHFSE